MVSTSEVPTGAMVVDSDVEYPARSQLVAALQSGTRDLVLVDAARKATSQLGDEQYANLLLAGVAYQRGAIPLAAASVEAAIRLNGVAVEENLAAFLYGRAISAGRVASADPSAERLTLDELVERRHSELVAYQDRRYADRYARVVEVARATGSDRFAEAAAGNLFKLMAYKDEYEVARLALDPTFDAEIAAEFGPKARISWQLHPPILRAMGRRSKISLGPWFRPALRMLAGLRRLRGTPFDPFGGFRVRRTERALIEEYVDVVQDLATRWHDVDAELAVRVAELPDIVRGYESIKLDSVARYRRALADLLAQMEGGASAAPGQTSRSAG